MKLFHYAAAEYDTLKTLERQGGVTQEDRRKALESARLMKKLTGVTRPGAYYQHISFFFEPIPMDIAKYFPKDHPVWKKGSVLFEHVVESSSLNPFEYEIVEFPEKRSLYLDESISDNEYHARMKEIYQDTRYVGFGDSELTKVVNEKKLIGLLEDSYKTLSETKDFLSGPNRYKYAPLVTHVMLYPDGGVIKPRSVKRVKLT